MLVEGGSSGAGSVGTHIRSGQSNEPGWEKVAAQLRRQVGKETFLRWFKEVELQLVDENTCHVLVPSETHVLWIEANYLPELTDALTRVLGICGRPELVVQDRATGRARSAGAEEVGGGDVGDAEAAIVVGLDGLAVDGERPGGVEGLGTQRTLQEDTTEE